MGKSVSTYLESVPILGAIDAATCQIAPGTPVVIETSANGALYCLPWRARMSFAIRSALTGPKTIVAIPVCNERIYIGACLKALADQAALEPGSFGIVLFLNNCTDDTAELVRGFRGMPWPMRVIERSDAVASAGWARRIAMDAAAEWIAESGAEEGVLLTTDADSRVGAEWVALNLAEIAQGAHAVAGRIALEPNEAALLPASLHARGRLESEYEALLMEIGARLDPEPGDPWPCHWSNSGATLAVTLSVYRQIGGMPDMPSGEDRAFVSSVRCFDLIVRHSPTIEVITSGRLEGRASGGVADTMKRRCEKPDSFCDDRLEGLGRFLSRVMWRRRLRRLFAAGRLGTAKYWASLLAIPRSRARELAEIQFFGQAYAEIEAISPRMRFEPLRPRELPKHIWRAQRLLRVLRAVDRPERAARRAGIRRFEPDATPAQTQPSTL